MYSSTHFVILSISQLSSKNLMNSCSKDDISMRLVKGNSSVKIICKTALFINEPVGFEGFD